MRKKVIREPPEVALDRVLAGLERELVEATDEEVVQAAAELGMNVNMKGIAAFMGLFGMPKRLEDIFDPEDPRESCIEPLPPGGARIKP